MAASRFLSQIPLFKGLSAEDRAELAALMRKHKVKKGETLFRKGSEGATLYIIQEGAIKIALPSRLGDQRIVTIFSAGDFFGEMALLDGMPRSADAIAVEKSVLFLLNRSDFLRFLKKSEAATGTILASLSMRLRKTDELLEDTSFLNISARLAKKLLDIGETFGNRDGNAVEIRLRLTQKDLADLVGATRESINKELRILREKGLLSITPESIRIHDIKRLIRRIH